MDMHQEQLQAEDLVYELLTELGNLYLELGNYDKAIEKLKKLIDLGETDSTVYSSLSKAYLQKSQLDDGALEVLEKTLEIDPENLSINKKLCQIYLETERIDAQAISVYFYLLTLDDELFQALSEKLIEIALQKDDQQVIRDIFNKFEENERRNNFLLMTYLKKSWETNASPEVGHFLAALLVKNENSFYSRLYILNLIQNAKQSPDTFELSVRDLEIYKAYLEKQEKFESFSELYLFLALTRLFYRFPVKAEDSEKPSIEEYELFLASDSFSNIWELGLNKEEAFVRNLGLNEETFWFKLQPISLNGNGDEFKQQPRDRIKEIFKRANSLMLIKAENMAIKEIEKNLNDILTTNAPDFINGFRTNDGFLIFGEDISSLTTSAEILLKNTTAKKVAAEASSGNLQIVVQNISLAKSKEFKYLFDDLELALSILPFDDEISLLSQNQKLTNGYKEHQILIADSVKNLIEADCKFSILPTEIKTFHPVTADEVLFYKLCWQDSLLKIKNGEIKQLGKFNINKELHPNQIFSSFKAVDSMLERLVVLKVLKPGFEIKHAQQNTKEIFIEQARLLGKLTHPNVALIYEVSEDQDLSFIAREFVEGAPIKVIKKRNKKVDWQQAVIHVIKTAEALLFTHGKNIIHGRLKPDNIFLVEKGEVKLTDFLLPGFSVPVKMMEHIEPKTLTYFAPELLETYAPTIQSDVFALGVILYELITGQNPFLDANADKIFNLIHTKIPDPASKLNPDVPKKLNEIVLQAIEKAPVKRFSDMSKFVAELHSVVES